MAADPFAAVVRGLLLQRGPLTFAALVPHFPAAQRPLIARLAAAAARRSMRGRPRAGILALADAVVADADRSDDPARSVVLAHAWVGLLPFGGVWRRRRWSHPAAAQLQRMADLATRCAARLPEHGPYALACHQLRCAIARQRLHHHAIESGMRQAEAAARGDPDLHAWALVTLHAYLCHLGYGRSCPTPELLAAAYRRRGLPRNLHAHRLMDAVEAGRLVEAEAAAQRADQDDPLVRLYGELLALFTAVRERRVPDRKAALRAAARLAAIGQDWFACNLRDRLALIERDPAALAALARRDDVLTHSQWLATAPIEAALLLGRTALVRHQLAIRQEHGLSQPSDAVLRARCLLAEDDREGAARAMDAALARAEAVAADGRIDLDLLMAPGLAPLDVVRLLRQRPPDRSAAATPAADAALAALVGTSPALIEVRALTTRFADSRLPVLITGPTGVGKELVARALHLASARHLRPLVVCSCGTLSEARLEQELFGQAGEGRADGVGTGLVRAAGDGTLVLDEIGEASPRLQVALLRLLDDGGYRAVGDARSLTAACRFVFSTNRDLDAAVAAGRFREDLLHRLRRLEIAIPPLAARSEDVLPIALHLLAGIDAQLRLSADAVDWLRLRPWPGNVRELRGLLERCCALGDAPVIDAARLQAAQRRDTAPAPVPAGMGARERRLARAIAEVRQAGRLRRSDLVRVLDVSAGTATTYLQLMVERGLVEVTGANASPAHRVFVWRGD